ncbi:unnamed protein product [Cylicocyclus nassatus]|uniref:Uncharacterized protein n=1 Tax=Cylicocyclus nassatus TaxID=53992 RepID=A0AA36H6Q0_CYLNA|nr:unnamed protein product [Cylicocyclus nassatus]
MMNDYRFVSSFYYPIESALTAVQTAVPYSQPVSPAQKSLPVNFQQLPNRAQKIELMKPQQVRRAVPMINQLEQRIVIPVIQPGQRTVVPDIKQPETDILLEKPFVESQYCISRANYSMKHPMSTNSTPVKTKISLEDQEHITMPPPPAEEYNPEIAVSPHVQCPILHQQMMVNHPPVAQLPQLTDATTSPARPDRDLMRYEIAKEKQIERVPDYSDYAWKRLEQEKLAQYAIRDYEHEQSLPPADAPFEAENVIPQHVGKFSICTTGEAIVEQAPPVKAGSNQPVDSEYVGIPNDLYPAYRKELTSYMPSLSQKIAPIHQGYCDFSLPDAPIPNDTVSESEKCDTAQENPIFQSRFGSQVKVKRTTVPAPPPVRLPEVTRYTTQYSTIGNAFAPVGQPQISEYQYEDLNDLASCIDAI